MTNTIVNGGGKFDYKYTAVHYINHSVGLCTAGASLPKSISLAKSSCKRNAFSLSNFEQTDDKTD